MIPEKKLEDFVRRMREAAGTNLESVILYGSAVAGDYHPEFSNLNLFCVLRDGSFADIAGAGAGGALVGGPEAASATFHDPLRTRMFHRRLHH